MLRKLFPPSRFSSQLSLKWRDGLLYASPMSSSSFQWREYHVTSILYKRNDGASGGIDKPREFSKKQQKRFKIKLNEFKEKKKNDPLKREKAEALRTHMESPEGKAFIQETQQK
jgi:hypothetical protein